AVGEPRAVERAVGAEDLGPEGLGQLGEHRRARRLELVDDGIGVDQHRPAGDQHPRHRALAASDASGEAHHPRHGGTLSHGPAARAWGRTGDARRVVADARLRGSGPRPRVERRARGGWRARRGPRLDCWNATGCRLRRRRARRPGVRHALALALAVGCLGLLAASRRRAAALPYTATLRIEFGTVFAELSGAGVATANGDGSGGLLTRLVLPGGQVATSSRVLPITDPAAFPIQGGPAHG